MAQHTVAWQGIYAPVTPMRIDPGTSLRLMKGDDIQIWFTPTQRQAQAIFEGQAFLREAVDVAGAKLIFILMPVDPRFVEDPVVKTTGGNGANGIVVTADSYGAPMVKIFLKNSDTENLQAPVYRASVAAQWTATDGTTSQGTLGFTPVIFTQTGITSGMFNSVPTGA